MIRKDLTALDKEITSEFNNDATVAELMRRVNQLAAKHDTSVLIVERKVKAISKVLLFGNASANGKVISFEPSAAGDSDTDEDRPLDFSEDSLAHHFTEAHKRELIYVVEPGDWHMWTGNYWKEEPDCKVFARARAICRPFSKMTNDKKIAKAATYAAVEKIARADHAVSVKELDRDRVLLNTPDGVVDLRTGLLSPAKPEQYMTFITSVAPKKMDTPVFDAFFAKVQPLEEIRSYLFRRWGYCLSGETREQCLFFDLGEGANGKGTCNWILGEILGPYAMTAGIELLTVGSHDRHPTELADLHRRRYVCIPETQQGRAWNEARVKTMTGEDPIRCHFMRQDNFEYVPEFKLSISGQYMPKLANKDYAMERRLQVTPWSVTVPKSEVDGQLKDKLRAELPGIFYRLIEGCKDWYLNGLQPPNIVQGTTHDYLASQDVVAHWLAERCEATDANGIWTSTRMLLGDLNEWCKLEKAEPKDIIWLGKYLSGKGYESKHKRVGSGFFIRLKATPIRDSGEPEQLGIDQ